MKMRTIHKVIDRFGNMSELARILGISQNNVWRWSVGQAAVPLRHALKIEAMTNGEFKVSDFYTDKDRRHINSGAKNKNAK